MADHREGLFEEVVKVNMRGHNMLPDGFVMSDTLRPYWKYQVQEAHFHTKAMKEFRKKEGRDWPDYYKVNRRYLAECSVCGNPVSLQENEDGSYTATTACEFPTGVKPFEVELNVPSGKMVFGNDFRDLFEDVDFNVNAIAGTISTVKAFEKEGMLHILVGNSCPSVFQKGKTDLCISREYDEATDERKAPGKGFKPVAWVCTDLWWVCAMDYEDYKKRCKAKGVKVDEYQPCKPLTVKPGKWVFTYNPMEGCEFTKCFGKWAK